MAVFFDAANALDRILIFDQQFIALPNKLVYTTPLVVSNLSVCSQSNDSFEINYSDFQKFAFTLLYFYECWTQNEPIPIDKTVELQKKHFCVIKVDDQSKALSLKTSTVEYKFCDKESIVPLLSAFYELVLNCYCYPAQVTHYLYGFLKCVTTEQLEKCDSKVILETLLIVPADHIDHYILLRYINRHKELLQLLKRIQMIVNKEKESC